MTTTMMMMIMMMINHRVLHTKDEMVKETLSINIQYVSSAHAHIVHLCSHLLYTSM